MRENAVPEQSPFTPQTATAWAGKVMLAPMAGVSDFPMREMSRRFGADLTYSEMVSSEGLSRGQKSTYQLLPEPQERAQVIVQLFGSKPDTMADAARCVEEQGALGVDINLGCPVKKVVRTGAGSALLLAPEKVREILHAMRAATRLPITLKIRGGWDGLDFDRVLEIAHIAYRENCQAVSLHPRSRKDMFSGRADWSMLRSLVEQCPIAVIGSGDVKDGPSAVEMIRNTGCAAIMVGRAAMGRPWIFSEIKSLLVTGKPAEPLTPQQKVECMMEHLRLAVNKYGTTKGFLVMRKHLGWYLKGSPGAKNIKAQIFSARDLPEMERLLETFAYSSLL